MRRVEGRSESEAWGFKSDEWSRVVIEAVRASTAEQGLPETLDDYSVLERVARVFGPVRRCGRAGSASDDSAIVA